MIESGSNFIKNILSVVIKFNCINFKTDPFPVLDQLYYNKSFDVLPVLKKKLLIILSDEKFEIYINYLKNS